MFPFRVTRGSAIEVVLGKELTDRFLRDLEFGPTQRVQVIDPEIDAVFESLWMHAAPREVAFATHLVQGEALADMLVRRDEALARLDETLAIEVGDDTILEVMVAMRGIDQSLLDKPGQLRYVLLADKVSAWSQANAVTALATYTGRALDSTTNPAVVQRRDRHQRLEVRVARTISDDAAGRDISAAQRLAADLRPVRDTWSAGLISFRHVAAFLDRLRDCTPELTTAVLDRIGDRLHTTPATRIGSVINAALAAIDPAGQAARARRARKHEVGVTQRTLADGLGQITVIDKVEITRAMIDRIDDDADQVLAHVKTCESCAEEIPAEVGPARAAAFRSLFFAPATDDDLNVGATADITAGGTATDPGVAAVSDANGAAPALTTRTSRRAARRTRRRGELQVVIDLATLLGLADNPALLAGQPIPADLARELATECGSLRRIVTDPVDGHLLDYGTRTYLPGPLKKHIAARDGTCRAPGCNQPAERCELEHIVPFPHGPSAVGNAHMNCKRDHIIKTDGDLQILAHRPDGSSHWRTRHGQTGVTPARPYLPETPRPPSLPDLLIQTQTTDPPDDDEPIPF